MFGSSSASPPPSFQNTSFGWLNSKPPSKLKSMKSIWSGSVDGSQRNRHRSFELFNVSMQMGRYSFGRSPFACR